MSCIWIQKNHQLYIYTDLTSYTFIGYVPTHILRVLAFESTRKTNHLHQEFVNVHYMPVAKSFIDQVHSISCDTGDSVSFIALAKLHFRQNDSTVNISKICFLMVLKLKTAVFWYKDELGAFEDMAKTPITECGKRVAKSKSVELQGRLHLDLAMQEKYLPNGSESKLKLNRSSPQFCLMSNGSHANIKIESAKCSTSTWH